MRSGLLPRTRGDEPDYGLPRRRRPPASPRTRARTALNLPKDLASRVTAATVTQTQRRQTARHAPGDELAPPWCGCRHK